MKLTPINNAHRIRDAKIKALCELFDGLLWIEPGQNSDDNASISIYCKPLNARLSTSDGELYSFQTIQTDKKSMQEILELIIEAAQQHGEDSDPEHEVGDLQDLCRALYAEMTEEQRERALARPEIFAILEWNEPF